MINHHEVNQVEASVSTAEGNIGDDLDKPPRELSKASPERNVIAIKSVEVPSFDPSQAAAAAAVAVARDFVPLCSV